MPPRRRGNSSSAGRVDRAERDRAQPSLQLRTSAESGGSQSRPPGVTLVRVVIALAMISVVVFAAINYIRTRHPPQPPTANSVGAERPTTVAASPAVPLPFACGVPASVLTTMSPRQKLAQLLMVGVKSAVDARQVVSVEQVGGIFITSWTDLTMLRDGELATIAQSAGPLGLAVSVDEEGGRVQRLSSIIGVQPSARQLARSETPQQVHDRAVEHGRVLRGLGITIDFAPVVDTTSAPDDTVIGDRSFSNKPDVVVKYAGAYAQGLRDAGVLPVLKHFPGHGRASGDSHMGGVVTPSLDELKTLDLEPYRKLAGELPVGVMIGHMVVPGLTDGGPASLSPAAVNLLRAGTGYGGPPFDGPLFTDDLSTMKAITNVYKVPDAVLKALQAGADTALWVSDTEVPAVLDRLVVALDSHELNIAKIDDSVRRMAKAKGFARCGS
jgi:beta-N-acetylhexosaminidase